VTENHGVGGSIPPLGTNDFNELDKTLFLSTSRFMVSEVPSRLRDIATGVPQNSCRLAQVGRVGPGADVSPHRPRC
jgi:hypothetical protein